MFIETASNQSDDGGSNGGEEGDRAKDSVSP